MNNRRPTGTDVARLAGVSKSAVSRVYAGGFVSEEARERIVEAARILKYRPNNTARSLTTNRSHLIGLAITGLDNQFYPLMVDLLHQALRDAGYRMVLFVTHGEADLDPVLDELLGYRLDGVILASSSHAARVGHECLEAGVPVVMLNNVDPEDRVPGVCTDNVAGAEEIARFLLDGGHRQLGVVSGLEESLAAAERAAAFSRIVEAHGEATVRTECGHFSEDGAYAAARLLLSGPNRVTALFCVTDFMAFFALAAARDLGLEPGRDVAIFGFDDDPISSWRAFQLATFRQPLEEMVATAVDMLAAQIRGQALPMGTRRLAGKIIPRLSASFA
ncbi:LacI family DNA-binding transcriptional regulator [Novosphingobium olei]|uniref:LacI family DNA-binding transcriptional regulator n=1 Tax=Novosphingobium olei TaxID=2728851 RepID=UPI00308F6C16|nr:substrate-binding domain-containing protein [Novosphingobium olei]